VRDGPEKSAPVVSEEVGVDFSVLFEREYAPLCRLAQLLVDDRSRAEEIVQEALTRSLAARPNLRDPGAAPVGGSVILRGRL